jgi:hypothetical protein
MSEDVPAMIGPLQRHCWLEQPQRLFCQPARLIKRECHD